jgi:hypothetical protein
MSFDENGFLSEDIETFSSTVQEKYKDYFTLCYDVNEFAEKVKFEFNIHNDNGQEIISSCIFLKILERYRQQLF